MKSSIIIVSVLSVRGSTEFSTAGTKVLPLSNAFSSTLSFHVALAGLFKTFPIKSSDQRTLL